MMPVVRLRWQIGTISRSTTNVTSTSLSTPT
jgi:hypothetical protein